MNKSSSKIDNATVLYWAWSGEKPFGVVAQGDSSSPVEIFGLAICKYDNSDVIYRFSCDRNWESVQDFDYHSVEEAKTDLPKQYRKVLVNWIKYND